MVKKLLILLGCACMAGCVPHFKSQDSYGTLFRNSEVTPPQSGDPYTFGGIGEGSGGQMARQSYATDNKPVDFRDATKTGRIGQIDKHRIPSPDGMFVPNGKNDPTTETGPRGGGVRIIDLGATRDTGTAENLAPAPATGH